MAKKKGNGKKLAGTTARAAQNIKENSLVEKIKNDTKILITSNIKKQKLGPEETKQLLEKFKKYNNLIRQKTKPDIEEMNAFIGMAQSLLGNLILGANNPEHIDDFLENLAFFRANNGDISLNQKISDNIEQLLKQISFDGENSINKLRFLLYNLDIIGLDKLPPNILEHAIKAIRDQKNPSISEIKNHIHLLVHCKNLGVFQQEQKTDFELEKSVNFISKYILRNQYSISTLQAAFDFLIYAKTVHRKIVPPEILKILSDQVKNFADTKPSTFQEEIFRKLQKNIEAKNQSSPEEWVHSSGVGDFEGVRKTVEYAGVSLTMEGVLEIDGNFYRNADIVVRNSIGKVLAVIEIDGPSHFYYDNHPNGKTKARNEILLSQSQYKSYFIACGNDKNDREQYLQILSQKIKQLIDRAIKEEIESAKSKEEEVPFFSSEELPQAAAADTKLQKERPKTPPPHPEEPKPTQEQIGEEFEKMLRNGRYDDLESTLSNTENYKYLKGRKIDGKDPLNFIFSKLNKHPENQNLLFSFLILRAMGIDEIDESLIKRGFQYPAEIGFILNPKEAPDITIYDLEEAIKKVEDGLAQAKDFVTIESFDLKKQIEKWKDLQKRNIRYDKEQDILTDITTSLIKKHYNGEIFLPKLYDKIMQNPKYKEFCLSKALISLSFMQGSDLVVDLINTHQDYIRTIRPEFKKHILGTAIEAGNYEAVKLLVEKCDVEVNEVRPHENPLCLAAYFGHIDIVNFLIERKDVKLDALHLYSAIQGENLDIIRAIACSKKAVRIIEKEGPKFILTTTLQGYFDIAKVFIDASAGIAGADVNGIIVGESNSRFTPLMSAAVQDNVKAIDFFLKNGADINKEPLPILHAAVLGKVKSVKFLVERGADISRIDKDGRTLLSIAAATSVMEGSKETVEYLISQGFNINHIDKKGETPLMGAIKRGNLEVAKVLVEKGANINYIAGEVPSPLFYSIEEEQPDIMRFLLQKGAEMKDEEAMDLMDRGIRKTKLSEKKLEELRKADPSELSSLETRFKQLYICRKVCSFREEGDPTIAQYFVEYYLKTIYPPQDDAPEQSPQSPSGGRAGPAATQAKST